MMSGKKQAAGLLTAAFFMLAAVSAHAESLFLKDGKIVEGKIAKETDAEVTLDLAGGGTRTIQRAQLLRVLYQSSYKEKRYISLLNGTELEGYIVDEDNSNYTYRADLSSAAEAKISKEEINGIFKNKPGGKPGKNVRAVNSSGAGDEKPGMHR